MLTYDGQTLALILVEAASKARIGWFERKFAVGQTQETRPGETMDFFTEFDEDLDDFLIGEIRRRLVIGRFLTEEGAKDRNRNAIRGRRAVIDSLDGSSNFMTGEVDFSISVAIEEDGVPQLGGIVTPVRGELLIAANDRGAYFLNCYGQPIEDVIGMIEQGALACVTAGKFALPQTKKRSSPLETARIYVHTGKRRNFELAPDDPWNTFYAKLANPGCTFCCTAALVKVALGKLDGAAIAFQNHWDYAAGRLLVEEAGGKFFAFTRDWQKILGPEEFAQANATKTAEGDEWLCHVVASRTLEIARAIIEHFAGAAMANRALVGLMGE